MGLIRKKKKTTLQVHHAFLYISMSLLLHDYNVKLDKLPSSNTRFMHEMPYVLTKCRMCSKKILLLVLLFAFFFTAAHFHASGR